MRFGTPSRISLWRDSLAGKASDYGLWIADCGQERRRGRDVARHPQSVVRNPPMDLSSLYQSLILDHNRRPRNFRELTDADRRSEGRNPLCGDQLTVWVKMAGDRIEDASFTGSGCAISKASASMMTAAVKGKTRSEASELFDRFHDL